jgi:hypothetical protein
MCENHSICSGKAMPDVRRSNRNFPYA